MSLLTALNSIKAKQLSRKFLVSKQLQFDEFVRKRSFHAYFYFFSVPKQIPFRVTSKFFKAKEMEIQYTFTGGLDVKVPNTWPFEQFGHVILKSKTDLNFSIIVVKISPKNFPCHFISLRVVLFKKR